MTIYRRKEGSKNSFPGMKIERNILKIRTALKLSTTAKGNS